MLEALRGRYMDYSLIDKKCKDCINAENRKDLGVIVC